MLGADIAGVVEEVGPNVSGYAPGDEVFCEDDSGGGFAEFATVSEGLLEQKPANLSFEHAAAVPLAGLTALQALRDHGRLEAGQRILIIGASGGVGTFAVQIAKSLGAHVTGVCSTRNVKLVRSIGADALIDYTREDFTAGALPDLGRGSIAPLTDLGQVPVVVGDVGRLNPRCRSRSRRRSARACRLRPAPTFRAGGGER